VLLAPSPSLPLISTGICFSADGVLSWGASTLPLSWSSPEGGQLNAGGFLHCFDHLLPLGFVARASPTVQAPRLAWAAEAVLGARAV